MNRNRSHIIIRAVVAACWRLARSKWMNRTGSTSLALAFSFDGIKGPGEEFHF